jgi:hypothetical protein
MHLSRPAHMSLAWLLERGQARAVPAVACLLPDCPVPVARQQGAGRPSWFCSSAHRHQFRRRRASLLRGLEELDEQLNGDATGGRSRTRVLADRRYLATVLLAYPDVSADKG